MATIDDILADLVLPAQDYITLNGTNSPGRAIVKGASSPRKWDKRDGYGSVGAAAWYIGEKLSEFEVEFALWEPAHFRDWKSFAKTFFSKGPENSTPVAVLGSGGLLSAQVPKKIKIDHPLLNMPPLLIKEVVVTDVGQFSVDDYGLYTCTVKFLEFKDRQQIAVGKAKDVPDVPKPAPIPAKTANELAIEQANAEVLALRAKLGP